MIQYNGSMNLGILQNRIQQGLQSKSQTAKKMATALNSYARTNKITHEAKVQFSILNALSPLEKLYKAMTDDGKTVSFDNYKEFFSSFTYKAPSEKFQNKDLEQLSMKSIDGQNPYFSMYYYDRNNTYTNNERLKMVSNEDNSKSMVFKAFGDRSPEDGIPLPALKTENGETKTTFIPLDNSHFCNESPLEPLFDSQIDLENDRSVMQNMIRFANKMDDNSPEEVKELKKQFNMIDFFQDNKYEVFDKPVELATEAYKQIQKNGTPDGQTEIIDLNDEGERLEVQKQGDVFNINFYNEDNQLSMKGTFKILKDGGVPLKEDKDGKIINQNDENYKNPQNKLCFNMKLSTYHQDLGVKSFDFERNIDLNDAKNRQNIKMSRYNRNGAFMRNEEASYPNYSRTYIQKRMCKVYYNVFKSDLKEAKAGFDHDMLNPNDLDPNLKNVDQEF